MKIVAGNWKMNGTHEAAVELATAILEGLRGTDTGDVRIVLAPPFVHLGAVRYLCAGEPRIHLAAQNCAAFPSGAYTGEVSAEMVRSVGAGYVIVGHSERRRFFQESDEVIARKARLALDAGLQPIVCCGETREDREGGRHVEVVRNQLERSLPAWQEGELEKTVVAYEPVWAIGTGLTASPEQAQEMHAFIRKFLVEKYGRPAAGLPLLYGGSCNEKNATDLFARPDIDGGLIGGASLNADAFIRIVKSY